MEKKTRAARRAATAERILDAARQEFADKGFTAATTRGIAERAGVDASLVLQHFGSKANLFAAAVKLPGNSSDEAAAHLLDVLTHKLGDPPPEIKALLRSMLTSPEAEEAVRTFLDERISNLAGTLPGPDAELRAALAVSGLLGVTIARHFLRLDALSRTDDELAHLAGPWLTSIVQEPREGTG